MLAWGVPHFFEGEGYRRMQLTNTIFPDVKLDDTCIETIPQPTRNYVVRPRRAYGAINSMNENTKLYKCKKFIKITF